MDKTYKLSVIVTEEEHTKIKELALKNKITMKKLILDSVNNYERTNEVIKSMKHRMYRLEYDARDK
jgi:hypothetical protein